MTLHEAYGLVCGLLRQHPKGVIVRDAWEVLDAHLAQHAQMMASFQKLYARIPVGPCSQIALDIKTILDADSAKPITELFHGTTDALTALSIKPREE